MTLVLRSATLADGRVVDLRLAAGSVAEVAPVIDAAPGEAVHDLAGRLLLPAPCEPHAHLDKAFLADVVPNPRGDLLTAISAMDAYRPRMTAADVRERAERAVRTMVANGTTAIRTHADLTLDHGLRSIEGLVQLKRDLADVVDLQIVAMIGIGVTGPGADTMRGLLADAIDAGADVVGGCPHLEPDPEGCLRVCLGLAGERGLPIDLHTDETLNPAMLSLRAYARLVRTSGFAGGATASHCVSLGVQPVEVQRAVAAEVAEAGIAVVALPQTNLFLQGRDHPVGTPRGLTALRPLLDAGAVVAGGADNLQDPFNTMGKGDAFETAALLVMAGHLTPEEAYDAVSNAARRAIGLREAAPVPGSPAEFVAVRARSVREAIASQPADRIVVHRGHLAVR